MADTVYTGFKNLAQRLITKWGRNVSLSVSSETPVSPTEPYEANAAPTIVSGIPAFFSDYNLKDVDGTKVQRGDKQCLIAKLDLPNNEPTTKDTIVDGSTNWQIISVGILQPGPVVDTVFYRIQVR